MINDLLHSKYYSYCFVLWCDSTSYDYNKVLTNVEWYYFKGKIKHFAYILHDKDYNDVLKTTQKPHIHLAFTLYNQWTIKPMLSALDLPVDMCNENIICKSYNGYLKYLTHSDINSKSKALYSINEVKTDDKDTIYSVSSNSVVDNGELFLQFVEWVYNFEDSLMSYYDAVQWCYNQGIYMYHMFISKQFNYMCTKLIEEHNKGMRNYRKELD